MRARLQKSNILNPPRYDKDLSSILVYNDSDEVIFAVTQTSAGSYKFTHKGLPDFAKEVKQITGMDVPTPDLQVISAKNG